MHGFFVDDIIRASTSEKLKLEIIAEYKGDFEITYEDLMTSFLGVEVGNHIIDGRERAKHIDLRKHFAHETIKNCLMCLIKIDATKQLANVFTKALAYPQIGSNTSAASAGFSGAQIDMD
jgi:hypothetical protein